MRESKLVATGLTLMLATFALLITAVVLAMLGSVMFAALLIIPALHASHELGRINQQLLDLKRQNIGISGLVNFSRRLHDKVTEEIL